MRRDHRLLLPLGLLLIALIALSVQSVIVAHYIYSSVLDPNWEGFVELYGGETPARGPDVFCFDYCAPKLPFVAGWIGIASFLGAWISLGAIWWKPRA